MYTYTPLYLDIVPSRYLETPISLHIVCVPRLRTFREAQKLNTDGGLNVFGFK
jgi:hypothetical protein